MCRKAMLYAAATLICIAMAACAPCRADPPESGPASVAVPPTANPSAPVAIPEPSEQAQQYYRSGNVLWIVRQLWGLAVPSVLLFSGFSARLRNLARRLGRKWILVVAVYFAFYSLIAFLLDLPLDYYGGFVRQHAYGLSNQTFGKWLGDGLKELLVGMVLGCLVLWVPYLLIRSSPRRWWLYTGLLSLPLSFFVALVVPIWIEPLFNQFGPMKNKPLEAEIVALARRARIEGGRVFEVDKSIDTETINAYVTGLGATKRIVLWDTLLAKLDEDQVLFVMAHEMGHYVLHHVIQGILLGSLGAVCGLYLVHRLAKGILRRWQGRFGFEELSDVASFPLLLLLFQLASLLLIPPGLAFSRHIEHAADRFALELTQNNRAAATAFVKMQWENLSNPRPGWFYTLWRGSHPSLARRIEFANEYRPWKQGRPLRYGEYFAGGQPED